MPDLCEAAAMDAAHFGRWGDAVEPCSEPAEVELDGYALCAGCADALETLGRIGQAHSRAERRRWRRKAERVLLAACGALVVLLGVAIGWRLFRG
jgi:hypothetical protein